jgi:hypothetical protein
MDKKGLCERYIEVINANLDREEKLDLALRAINPDNSIFGLIPESYEMLTNDMFRSLVGESIYDWVTWWLYDTDQKSSKVWINNEEFNINSFDELWEKVLKDE